MGMFSLSITVLSIFAVFGRLGLDTALLRFFGEYLSQGKKDIVQNIYFKSIKLAVLSSVILSILLYFCAGSIASEIFKKPQTEPFFKITSFAILPLVLLFINTESIRGIKKIWDYTILQLILPFLFGSVILASLLLSFRYSTLPIIAYVLSLYFVAIISFLRLFKISKTKPQIENTSEFNLKSILGISLPMMTTSSLSMLMKWTDIIMLGIFTTNAEVGIYSVAVKISALTSIFLFATNSIAAPKFAEFHGQKDKKNLAIVARKSTELIFYSTLPIILLFWAFPSFFLGIFGVDFKTGSTALVILTLGQFANAFCGSVGYILQMTGHQKKVQSIVFQASMINIVLNAILIPQMGMNGAAIASSISMIYWNVYMLITVKKKLGFLTLFFAK